MSPIPDPLKLWRNAISELESSGNAFAKQTMNTAEFATALHQMANLSLGMQQAFEKVVGLYLKQLNLPSRKDFAEMSATLQRIEARLEQLGPAPAPAAPRPRPPRTRTPAPAVGSDETPATAASPAHRATSATGPCR